MNDTRLVSELFLFDGIADERINELLRTVVGETVEYARGDVIFAPEEFEKKIGFVLAGGCEVVRRRADGASVPLNRLGALDSFGILALFAEGERFPTFITATKTTRVLFFTRDEVMQLISAEPAVSMNVIHFLADRVSFLNKKIATLANSSAEEKLSAFLLERYRELGAEFSINCKKASEALSLGRASLYRALKQLEDEGTIKYDTKKIYICDPKGLERNAKK